MEHFNTGHCDLDLKPDLTEPGVKFFLNNALKQSHMHKEQFYNMVYNICILIGFILILAGVLVYKYKGKLTPLEISQKNKEKQQYVLERIKQFQISKRKKEEEELITGLPHWNNEYNELYNTTIPAF